MEVNSIEPSVVESRKTREGIARAYMAAPTIRSEGGWFSVGGRDDTRQSLQRLARPSSYPISPTVQRTASAFCREYHTVKHAICVTSARRVARGVSDPMHPCHLVTRVTVLLPQMGAGANSTPPENGCQPWGRIRGGLAGQLETRVQPTFMLCIRSTTVS